MRDALTEGRITRKEIQVAMEDFFAKGGKIKVLPPQLAFPKEVIGGEGLMMYEDVIRLFQNEM